MATNTLDKYYTPEYLVKHTVDKAIEILGIENITEVVEPAAGDGAFIPYLKATFLNIPLRLYDLYPEHPEIIEQDYKKLRLSYKKGRLTIGNPPFGTSSSLWKAFCKKAASNSDFIVYISPASQYNSNYYFKEGVLVYSELLNDIVYRGSAKEGGKDQAVKTCLNIYKVYNREEDEDWRLNKINSIVKYGRHMIGEGDYDYDYYLAHGTSGPRNLTLITKGEYKYCWGVKVLDEKYRSKIEEFLKNINQYDKELKSLKSAFPILDNAFFTSKLKTFLFPTREERLNSIVKFDRTYKDIPDEFEYHLKHMGSGNVGFLCKKEEFYSSFGVKVLDENYRSKIEEFLNNFKQYDKEIKANLSGPPFINKSFFLSKLKTFLFPTREERLAQDYPLDDDFEYTEVKTPVKIERALYAKELW